VRWEAAGTYLVKAPKLPVSSSIPVYAVISGTVRRYDTRSIVVGLMVLQLCFLESGFQPSGACFGSFPLCSSTLQLSHFKKAGAGAG
jgi:hypothetical protein